jgi:hypothetical protein
MGTQPRQNPSKRTAHRGSHSAHSAQGRRRQPAPNPKQNTRRPHTLGNSRTNTLPRWRARRELNPRPSRNSGFPRVLRVSPQDAAVRLRASVPPFGCWLVRRSTLLSYGPVFALMIRLLMETANKRYYLRLWRKALPHLLKILAVFTGIFIGENLNNFHFFFDSFQLIIT